MKRREFVERLGLGSAVLLSGTTVGHGSERSRHEQSHVHEQVTGALSSATVSFGQWMSVDRLPNNSPRDRNRHLLIPYMPRG